MDMNFTQWSALPRNATGPGGAAVLESLPAGLREELGRGGDFWSSLLDHLRQLHSDLPEDLDPEGLLALLGSQGSAEDEAPAGLLMGLLAAAMQEGGEGGRPLPSEGGILPAGRPEAGAAKPPAADDLMGLLLGQRLAGAAAPAQEGANGGRAEAGWQQALLLRAVGGQGEASPLVQGEGAGRILRFAEGIQSSLSSASPDGGLQPGSLIQTPNQGAVLRPLTLETPVAQPNWNEAVGNRVLWMVNQNVQGAELKLNPPQLGPLEVRISMEGDRAHVQFVAHHPATREALDAAIPRLREMLAGNGVDLGNVDVSQRQAQGGETGTGGGGGRQDPGAGGGEGEAVPGARVQATSASDRDSGLLDAYA
ncbi:flagellar hook-length control protein FliK [Ectothiorhodospira mobilis]|uniref:Flagellar hook-length control protein FliK n=1 Tax=Ectothiorhodospira mobilis TaxID=195064 RepID=A0A1I4QHH7_ECTMO|nr:flagellar hook-length control protein FliK [Ectothiorhodospira mobilis]